jgi:hypothetical protein
MPAMFAMIAWMLWSAAEAASGPVAKLPVPVAKEMSGALVALNKVLGLESWPGQGFESCLDRGGLEATAKDVSAEDTKKCADTALTGGFPELGKSYVIGIPMAGIGPVTVFAVGLGAAQGWGAYSCDATRPKCPPTKLDGPSKQAKRLAERYRRACADRATIWLPAREGVCGASPGPVQETQTPTMKD